MNKRNRIIIIGNGFDLAHGLKTSYSNFIDWLWNKKVEEINEVIKKFPSHRIIDKDDMFIVDEGKKGEFNDANELKRWITYKSGLLETLERKKNELKDPKWSDIEDVYYDCLLKCNNRFDSEKEEKEHEELSIIKLNREFRVLRTKLIEYLQSVYDSVDKDSPEFIRLIQRMKSILYADKNEIEKIVFINFNYTNTLEFGNYIESHIDFRKDTEVVYIHGNLKDENSIIFGYGDELDSNSLSIQENKDNAFLEFNKAVLYARSGEYKKIVPYIYSNSDYEVYILGHSCANSDRALLNEILDNKHCQSIKYYYYDGSQGKEANFKEQISNLYRIFGDNHRNFRSIFCPLHKSGRIPQIRDIENFIVNESWKVSNWIVEILGMQFVWVQGGYLGENKIEGFWIGRYPVTEFQWKNITGEKVEDENGDDYPITGLRYNQCLQFVRELTSQTGREFSLPTKDQWIYAARGGCFSKGYKYAGSNNINEVAWYKGNSANRLHPVGQKKPNELGIYDMSGNVWEYVNHNQRTRNSSIFSLITNKKDRNEKESIIRVKDIENEIKSNEKEELYTQETIELFNEYIHPPIAYGGEYCSSASNCQITSNCEIRTSKKEEHKTNCVGFRVILIQKGNSA